MLNKRQIFWKKIINSIYDTKEEKVDGDNDNDSDNDSDNDNDKNNDNDEEEDNCSSISSNNDDTEDDGNECIDDTEKKGKKKRRKDHDDDSLISYDEDEIEPVPKYLLNSLIDKKKMNKVIFSLPSLKLTHNNGTINIKRLEILFTNANILNLCGFHCFESPNHIVCIIGKQNVYVELINYILQTEKFKGLRTISFLVPAGMNSQLFTEETCARLNGSERNEPSLNWAHLITTKTYYGFGAKDMRHVIDDKIFFVSIIICILLDCYDTE